MSKSEGLKKEKREKKRRLFGLLPAREKAVKKGEAAKLRPEYTAERLITNYVGFMTAIGSFVKEREGEEGLKMMFESIGKEFAEPFTRRWGEWRWRADLIAKNMIQLNFQPFGMEAEYSGNETEATITIYKCPMPEQFMSQIDYLMGIYRGTEDVLKTREMFTSGQEMELRLRERAKNEACGVCKFMMPSLGNVLGFDWDLEKTLERGSAVCKVTIKVDPAHMDRRRRVDELLMRQADVLGRIYARAYVHRAKKEREMVPLDVFTLLELPDHLRTTAINIARLGRATAEDVAGETKRPLAVEEKYLDRLVRMRFINREEKEGKIYFYLKEIIT